MVDGWNKSHDSNESGSESKAVKDHMATVMRKVCESGRGNVFNKRLEDDIKDLYPSFFDVLRAACGGGDVAGYEHHFEDNQMGLKIAYELKALKAKGKEE